MYSYWRKLCHILTVVNPCIWPLTFPIHLNPQHVGFVSECRLFINFLHWGDTGSLNLALCLARAGLSYIKLSAIITWFHLSQCNIRNFDVNQTSNSQQTPHTSPSRASYGVSIMRIFKKIDHVILALIVVKTMAVHGLVMQGTRLWAALDFSIIYRQVSNISRTLAGYKTVDHSDVVGASPVGAASTTSSLST